jgi:hypothetical protein
MYESPFDELAVNDLAPLNEAPMHTPIALCSLSTGTIRPLVNLYLEAYSMISVRLARSRQGVSRCVVSRYDL